MKTRPFSILILEDSPEIQAAYRRAFIDEMPECVLYFATYVQQGIELLGQHPEVDAIVVDGQLSHGSFGCDFVRQVRGRYCGLMLANSSSKELNAQMCADGCADDTRGNKALAACLVHAHLKASMSRIG